MSTTLQYPYRWGKTIVQKLVESYPRGTDYLAELLCIARKDMLHLLNLLLCSGNSVKWEGIKRLIKYNETNSTDELKAYTPEIRRQLYKRLVSLCIDDYLDDAWQLYGIDMTENIVENSEGHDNEGNSKGSSPENSLPSIRTSGEAP